jgi:Kdo2-lipid IVA lauroyltransferase/acyltransferase
VLYASRSALAAVRLLRRGEALLVLGDDPTHATVTRRVEFLDGFADLPVGPVRLSRLAAAPIVTFAVLPTGPRRWRIVVDPPLEPPAPADGVEGEQAVMQAIAARWSELIRRHPEHWAASFRIAWYEDADP